MGNVGKPLKRFKSNFNCTVAKMGVNWNICVVKMIPISDFVALEEIDLTVCMLQTCSCTH